MLLVSACSNISAVSTLGAYSSSHENRGYSHINICLYFNAVLRAGSSVVGNVVN